MVFADVCTKEAASARVDGANITPLPPKSSDAAPTVPNPQLGQSDAEASGNASSAASVSQVPTSTNYAGKTYQDFLAATAQAQK